MFDKNNTPKFLKFESALPYSKANEQTIFNKYLNLSSNDKLIMVEENTDKLGVKTISYQQYYKDVKLEYGQYKVHVKNGKINIINGNFIPVESLSVNPKITKDEALKVALDKINAKKYFWELKGIHIWQKNEKKNNVTLYPQGKLVIWSDIENKDVHLAYKFDIYSIQPLGRDFVFIDAQTGEFIDKEPIMFNSGVTGILTTRYSGTLSSTTDSYGDNYGLHDPNRGNGIFTYDMNTGTNFSNAVDFIDNDNNWTSGEWHNTQKDDAALDAHWALQKTYDYFHDEHNRNSYDNQNAAIRCYVHYKINWENASWDGSRILIGDGASNFDALASIDVLAHEFGHAVCSHTCNLRYGYYESAALNEGLSDIWGICVENFSTTNKQTWKMGEDITIKQGYNCLRDIQKPKSTSAIEGQHPDTYHGSYWDYGNEPHNNSTILSHWFYLLAHGGSGTNDLGNSFNISGIGIDKASDIVYRMETQYLSSNSDYLDASTYAIQAAEDIYGANTIEVYTTTNAWYAVGIGNQYYDIKITGANLVCTSNSTFTLQNRPPNSSVSWTHSSNLTPVGCDTCTTYIVRANGCGIGNVTATINEAHFTKTVWVGKPGQPVTNPYGYPTVQMSLGQIKSIRVTSAPGYPYQYIWNITGSIEKISGGGSHVVVEAVSTGWGNFKVKTRNQCGYSTNGGGSVNVSSGGGWLLSISPNPATSEATITVKNNSKQGSLNKTEQWDIEIYNQSYMLQEKRSKLKDNTIRINTSSWKEGIYYIKAVNKDKIVTGKMIIKR